jgi:hypothetical protein
LIGYGSAVALISRNIGGASFQSKKALTRAAAVLVDELKRQRKGYYKEHIEASGLEEWLAGLREDLVARTYRPMPVRRVIIPKPGGGYFSHGTRVAAYRAVDAHVYDRVRELPLQATQCEQARHLTFLL